MTTIDEYKQQFKIAIDKILPLGNECWSEIENHIFTKQIEKNELFSKEGDIGKDLCLVLDGILRIYHLNEKGEQWNKYFLQKDNFVIASITPNKASISNIQALTKSTLLCIPYLELTKIAARYKQIHEFVQKLTFGYLEEKQVREIRLLSENALTKYQQFTQEFPGLEDEIQHYHIASYLGITPTQLSRLRRK